jgi:hypothetical protein
MDLCTVKVNTAIRITWKDGLVEESIVHAIHTFTNNVTLYYYILMDNRKCSACIGQLDIENGHATIEVL